MFRNRKILFNFYRKNYVTVFFVNLSLQKFIKITGDSSDTQYYYSADQECTGIRASDTQYCLVGDNEYSLPVTPTAKLSFQYDDASVYQVLEDNGASQRVGE